ncbi:MAG: nucleotidyltransferase domain-containing protein [Syntrophorhabdaceae bacterium]|nr:nucleotidyltransferase domain-containing protein [Syntrophorhabdaceae bacterium]
MHQEELLQEDMTKYRAKPLRMVQEEKIDNKIDPLIAVLRQLRSENKVLVAVLYGSYSKGTNHRLSDIDIGLYINTDNELDTIEVIDAVRMAIEDDTEVSILFLHDKDESPFIVQEALKGIHLVDPDIDTLYEVADWALHEAESIRFRNGNDI